ncbi:MAG: complement resistance protein TraT [Nitrospirales bacterium]
MKVFCKVTVNVVILGLLVWSMSGCKAIHTSIAKKDLDVQTKMSDSIFLDPVGPDKKVIFIDVRNTSDKDNFDIETPIKAAITKRGYRVTEDPDEAHYRLQANVLSVAKTSPTAAEAALGSGYGGVLGGAAAGAGVGIATGHGSTGGVAGGLIGSVVGGLTETVADAFVKDVLFMAVTDVQLVEKAAKGVIVRSDSEQNLAQGMAGSQRQTFSEVGKLKKYRTRVVSTANKANLEYVEAEPLLTKGLTRVLSNLF